MKRFNFLFLICIIFSASSIYSYDLLNEPLAFEDRKISDSYELGHADQIKIPQPTEKVMRYYHTGNILWFVSQFWNLIIPALFLFTGFSAKLRTWARIISDRWYFTLLFYFSFYFIIYQVISIPLSLYATYLRPHDYGLSTQPLGAWYVQYLLNTVIVLMIGALFLWIPYILIKKYPTLCWFYAAILSIPTTIFFILIYPIWIQPIFNEFKPFPAGPLRSRIENLAERTGIDSKRIYIVNKSKETNRINAYVVGWGRTQRIVIWDTAIKELSNDELMFVLAHEMGHYKLGHIWISLLYFSLTNFLIFFLIYKVGHYLINRFRYHFHFQKMDDVASFPLLILLFNLFSFITEPIDNAFSQYREHEADRFGLELTQNNRAAAEAFVVLQRENLINPSPGLFYRLWIAHHPPLQERINFSNNYHPWDQQIPLFYQSLFKEDLSKKVDSKQDSPKHHHRNSNQSKRGNHGKNKSHQIN